MQYIPAGRMCMGCAYRERDCSKLPFSTMPKLLDYGDGVIKVKCRKYKKEKQ